MNMVNGRPTGLRGTTPPTRLLSLCPNLGLVRVKSATRHHGRPSASSSLASCQTYSKRRFALAAKSIGKLAASTATLVHGGRSIARRRAGSNESSIASRNFPRFSPSRGGRQRWRSIDLKNTSARPSSSARRRFSTKECHALSLQRLARGVEVQTPFHLSLL